MYLKKLAGLQFKYRLSNLNQMLGLISFKNQRVLLPQTSFKLDTQILHLSKILHHPHDNSRIAIMYALQEDSLMPRLLWKYGSAGNWRVSPKTIFENNEYKFYKGAYIHYTQGTYLVPGLLEFLNQQEHTEISDPFVRSIQRHAMRSFEGSTLEADQINCNTYCEEVSIYRNEGDLSGIQKYMPGDNYHVSNKTLARLKYPTGFVPDFKNQNPLLEYQYDHSLLGQTQVEIYSAKLDEQNIIWGMANHEDKYWIDFIQPLKPKITSYGIPSKIINTGILTSKPLEYLHQSKYLKSVTQYNPFNKTFNDITPMLSHLAPIREYREAKQGN